MGPRENNLQSGSCLVNLVNQGLDAISGTVDLPGRLVAFGKNSFDLPQIDEDIPVPLPLIVADDHLTDFLLELRVEGILLNIPQGLFCLLFGALHRYTVKFLGVDLN